MYLEELTQPPRQPAIAAQITATGVPIIAPSGVGDVVGLGTTGTIPLWTDGPNSVIGDSLLTQASGNVALAAGNFGIGTITPASPLNLVGTSTTDFVFIDKYQSDANAALMRFRRARGTPTVPSIVNVGDSIGSLVFQGYDGTTFRNGAQIIAGVDLTPGASDMPTNLKFLVTPDGSATLVERLRIKSDGFVCFGGATNAFPALVKSVDGGNLGTLLVELADGSAFTDGNWRLEWRNRSHNLYAEGYSK